MKGWQAKDRRDMMEARMNYKRVAPGASIAISKLEEYVDSTGLEASLLNLVKIRASQLNGCAWCLDMHTKDARAGGETEQRLYALSAWRETPFYTKREKAALDWTESVTLVSQTGIPDQSYEEARKEFSEKELVDLTMAVIAINSWNRLNVAFRTVPGTYQPSGPPKQVSDAGLKTRAG